MRWTCALRHPASGRGCWSSRFDRTDRLVLAGFAGLLIVVTALSFAGLTTLWVPEALIDLAG